MMLQELVAAQHELWMLGLKVSRVGMLRPQTGHAAALSRTACARLAGTIEQAAHSAATDIAAGNTP